MMKSQLIFDCTFKIISRYGPSAKWRCRVNGQRVQDPFRARQALERSASFFTMAKPPSADRKPRALALVLTPIFFVALIMGTCPGAFLPDAYVANPSPDSPVPATIAGMPAIYAWTVFWFFVEAAVVVIAAFTLWKEGDEA